MSLGTYTGLQASVSDYIARSDLAAVVPDFITLAEAKFNRQLRCIQQEKRSSTTVNMSSAEPEFITLPTDFQTMRRVRLSSVTGKPRLEFMTGANADEYRQQVGDVAGQPGYFTVFGNEIELIRSPDQAYTLEMIYRANIPPLGLVNSSNWLLVLAPDAYLYGALMEAAPYLKDDSRIQIWSAGLSSVVDELNKLSQAQAYGSGPLVMRTGGPTP